MEISLLEKQNLYYENPQEKIPQMRRQRMGTIRDFKIIIS